MTLEEYNEWVDLYKRRLKTKDSSEKDAFANKFKKFKLVWMEKFLNDYKKRPSSESRKKVVSLFEYVVYESTNGVSTTYADSKSMATRVVNLIYREIGEYVIDCMIHRHNDNLWVINVTFGKDYVPHIEMR